MSPIFLESYNNTIIGNLVNTITADFLLHKVQCWCACAVYKYNWDTPMVMYCSGTMQK